MSKYFSLSHLATGFVAVLIGFTSSVVLIFQAATLVGATNAQISSWIVALALGIGSLCIGLSLYYKQPILMGWSTPGAALLVTSLKNIPMNEAIGAFIMTALLTLMVGLSGLFEKLMKNIPQSLTYAMLAGILLQFGINVFVAMNHEFSIIFLMFLVYLVGKRYFPRYVILILLVLTLVLAKLYGLLQLGGFHFALPALILVKPSFTFSAFMTVTIPLFVVNLTTQTMPGIAILKANGYNPPLAPLLNWPAFITLLLAPFGSYAVCLAAITSGISSSKDADIDPNERFKATVIAGVCWWFIAFCGGTVVYFFSAFPKELILALTGIALFTTIGQSLNNSLEKESEREASIITLLITASGMSFFGIGAAFWGLVGGLGTLFFLNKTRNIQFINNMIAK